MKIGILFLFFILSILILPLVISVDIDDIQEQVNKIQDVKDKYSDTSYWNEKWDYLGKEWKNILMKNKFVTILDGFFTKISVVFQILFGVPYSMSFVLLGIVFLWIFVFLEIGRIFNLFEKTHGLIAYLISAGFAIFLAQLKLFESLILLAGQFIFSFESLFMKIILFCLVIGAFIFLNHFIGILIISFKKDIEKQEKEEEKLNRWTLKKIVEIYKK